MSTTTFLAPNCAALTREQDEWGAVEWFLQMTYRSSSVSVRALWSVSNPAVAHHFARRSAGKQVARVVALADELPVAIRQICERGVQQPLQVVVGNQALPGTRTELSALSGFRVRKRGAGRRMYEAMLFRVAVGIAQTIPIPATGEIVNPRDIPTDFDAYLLEQKDEEELLVLAAQEGERVVYLAPSAFRQSYLLKDGSQVLPEFVVQFEVDDDKSEEFCLPPCANCERAAATVWCVADEAALCGHCDAVEHDEDNKITARHQRVPINERPSVSVFSEDHHSLKANCAVVPSEAAALWDPTLGLALSTKAVKEALVQPSSGVMDFQEAYKTVVKAARREDAFTAAVKKTLMAEVQSINDELRAVAREKDEAELRVNSVVEAAVARATEIAKEKSATLLAAQERISEQLEFVQWAMTVLTPYADRLSPADWLRLWSNLNQLVKKKVDEAEMAELAESDELSSLGQSPFLIHLQANLRVNSN